MFQYPDLGSASKMVILKGKFASANQNHHSDLGIETSSDQYGILVLIP